jgi:hypothetical protein
VLRRLCTVSGGVPEGQARSVMSAHGTALEPGYGRAVPAGAAHTPMAIDVGRRQIPGCCLISRHRPAPHVKRPRGQAHTAYTGASAMRALSSTPCYNTRTLHSIACNPVLTGVMHRQQQHALEHCRADLYTLCTAGAHAWPSPHRLHPVREEHIVDMLSCSLHTTSCSSCAVQPGAISARPQQ